jgi:L-ectoine synthase
MIIRRLPELDGVEWGNGLSRRFLVEDDGMGYTLTDTIVWPNTSSALQYRKHLEACYCISGSGEIVDYEGKRYRIEPGTMYALDQHDAHHLVAAENSALRLVCVFSPALRGDERHTISDDGYSEY